MRLAAKYILLLGRKGGGVLPAPTNLSPTGFISDTEPNLTWDAVAGATDYTVQVRNAADTLVFEDTSATSPTAVSPALDPLDSPFTATVSANPDGAVATTTFSVYILVDEFTTPVAAGAVNGTTADGTGQTRTVVDTNSRLSVSTLNGLEFVGAQASGNPSLHYPQIPRQTGVAVAWRFTPFANAATVTGTDTDATGNARDGMYFANTSLRWRANNSQGSALSKAYANEQPYDVVVIARDAGSWIFIRGGTYTNWTLAFVDHVNTSNIFPSASPAAGVTYTAYARRVRAAQLSEWTSQFANAAFYSATSTAGETANAASGDMGVLHTITAQTGVTQEIMVRRVDDNNCIIVRMDQGASTIRVYRKEAGVETELTGGTTSQTWTNATQYRVYISCYGSNIIVSVDVITKNDTTSSFQAAETGVKVSHAGEGFAAYNLVLTGDANVQLDAFFPA